MTQDFVVNKALSKISSGTPAKPSREMCDSMRGSLIKKQINFCKRNPSFMDSVRVGAVRAIDECQFQFRARRWNCSTLENTINANMEKIRQHLGPKKGRKNKNKPAMITYRNTRSHNNNEYNANNEYNGGYGSNDKFGNHGNNRRGRGFNRRALRRGRRLSRRARHGADNAADDEDTDNETKGNATGNGKGNATGNGKGNARGNGNTRGNGNSKDEVARSEELVITSNAVKDMTRNNRRIMQRRNNNTNTMWNAVRVSGRSKDVKDAVKKGWQAALGPYPIVSPGTREMAFVHAISSAGVAHALTRACSAGELENCGCDRSLRGTTPEGFEWSGCSDNVDFGITFSRSFVDARDRRKSRKRPRNAKPLMNLHNNEAGRKLLERNMKVECKCHGVSGSCELKTCWRSVASFRVIGELLKEKFDTAHEVQQRKRRGRRMLLPRFQRFKPHTETDLVYLKSSPDYCEFNPMEGSLGTHGRECNPKSSGLDGCELMCCNRGYTTRLEKRVERCRCKFHWCCFVECEQCYREVEVSTCK